MKDHSLFFIALGLPQALSDEILSITQKISNDYKTRKALSSPPHITLVPPFWYPNAKIDALKNTVSELKLDTEPISIRLDGFSSFPSRVLFINVVLSPELSECHERVYAYLPKDLKSNIKVYREYSPHITIAFKDISQENFEKAQNEYIPQSYIQEFSLENIDLYRHDGQKWLIVK
jgi:2'-5' RNA ligase